VGIELDREDHAGDAYRSHARHLASNLDMDADQQININFWIERARKPETIPSRNLRCGLEGMERI
jgi:hypothetical protein